MALLAAHAERGERSLPSETVPIVEGEPSREHGSSTLDSDGQRVPRASAILGGPWLELAASAEVVDVGHDIAEPFSSCGVTSDLGAS